MATTPYESFVYYMCCMTIFVALQLDVIIVVSSRYRKLRQNPFSSAYLRGTNTLYTLCGLSILSSLMVLGVIVAHYGIDPTMDYLGRIGDFKQPLGILVWCEIGWFVLNLPVTAGLAVALHRQLKVPPMEAYLKRMQKA